MKPPSVHLLSFLELIGILFDTTVLLIVIKIDHVLNSAKTCPTDELDFGEFSPIVGSGW